MITYTLYTNQVELPTESPWNAVMSRDMSDCCIRIPGFGNVMPMADYTLEFWNNTFQVSGPEVAFTMDNQDNGTNRVMSHVWWTGDGRLYFDNGNIGAGGTSDIGRISGPHPDFLQNQWHHLCYQVDAAANQMRVFVDGKLFLQENHYDTFKRLDCDFIIGGPAGLRHYGAMSEFRIWNYVLTQQQIQARMQCVINLPQPGMIGCWRLDDSVARGGSIVDRSGNGFNGVLI